MTFKITAAEKREILKRRKTSSAPLTIKDLNKVSFLGAGIFMVSGKKAILTEISGSDIEYMTEMDFELDETVLEDEAPDLYKILANFIPKYKALYIIGMEEKGYLLSEKPIKISTNDSARELGGVREFSIKKPGLLITVLYE